MSESIEERTGFVEREPAIATAVALWVLTNVGAILVGHTHVVTAEQWGAVATYLTPFVSGGILAAVALILRRFVAPAWKLLQREAQKVGVEVPDLLDDTSDVEELPPPTIGVTDPEPADPAGDELPPATIGAEDDTASDEAPAAA